MLISELTRLDGVFPFRLSCKFQVKMYAKVLRRNGNLVNKGRWQLATLQLQLNKLSYLYFFVLNIIFSCRKMVKILLDFIVKLQQFPLLPYRWSNYPLRRNGNNDTTWNLQLRRNGNKPSWQLLHFFPRNSSCFKNVGKHAKSSDCFDTVLFELKIIRNISCL